MNDALVRFISISAGVFIAIITISAVMTYYTTAQNSASKIGLGVNIPELKNQNITDSLTKTIITGTEVKNIVNYFYEKPNVKVNVSSAKKFDGKLITDTTNISYGGTVFNDINHDKIENDRFKTLMKNINPVQRFRLTKVLDSEGTRIDLIGLS